jgi:hypothetical protein
MCSCALHKGTREAKFKLSFNQAFLNFSLKNNVLFDESQTVNVTIFVVSVSVS